MKSHKKTRDRHITFRVSRIEAEQIEAIKFRYDQKGLKLNISKIVRDHVLQLSL